MYIVQLHVDGSGLWVALAPKIGAGLFLAAARVEVPLRFGSELGGDGRVVGLELFSEVFLVILFALQVFAEFGGKLLVVLRELSVVVEERDDILVSVFDHVPESEAVVLEDH